MGRISTIKMNILPRILFLFQTIPVLITEKTFKIWQKDLSKFIWQGKKPRIKFKLLQDDKEKGGFGLLDLRLYYEACGVMWLKEWIILENHMTLNLEGHYLKFGWHGFLWYDKIKANKAFNNHCIRSLFLEYRKNTNLF